LFGINRSSVEERGLEIVNNDMNHRFRFILEVKVKGSSGGYSGCEQPIGFPEIVVGILENKYKRNFMQRDEMPLTYWACLADTFF
jgi:hypothetical protein